MTTSAITPHALGGRLRGGGGRKTSAAERARGARTLHSEPPPARARHAARLPAASCVARRPDGQLEVDAGWGGPG